ncbi:uncharacterized protein LOC127847816 isoform X5 [Dreissena polymorpha]|uniref:uncharacterized protein LOC127847816 isoform X4 n=1 Tax=Dreissena polymorpha TaxID=45954 RepID=UPI0022646905|nr:uncharacterized protein LOC127847816 isoform X4 [Dreissena polymorpha]XP_052235971.1 uncharacterized protein LOC127847816 isoform X5 [Dreissena polymorpha]
MDRKSAIINEFDFTTQTGLNTMSATVSVATLNSDQEQGDLNSVCVKIETDEWYNTAADLYSVYAKSEQVLWEERQPDCNKQDDLNEVHEKTGSLQIDQDYTKQDGFMSECVKSEHTEYEIMQQDVNNSVCVNRNNIVNSTAYTEKDEFHSVCGTTKQLLNPNTDKSYIHCVTTNYLNYVGGIAIKLVNTDTDNGNRTEKNPNALCDYSNAIEHQAQLADLNSEFLPREKIELSNVDQYCARPTVGGGTMKTQGEDTIQKDLYSNLDVHRHSNSKKNDSGKELLVWCGDEFARELGLIRDKNVCSDSSKHRSHLKIPMRKHTGEKHYKCEMMQVKGRK